MNTTSFPRRRGSVAWVAISIGGSLLVGLIAGPVLAGAMAPRSPYAAAPSADGDTPEHTISVTGSGKVTVVPDMATVRLGVLVERKSAREARQVAAAGMTRVIAAIRKLGVDDKDITTSIVSLGPVYDYPNNTSPRIRGYQLQNAVSVKIRDLAKVSDVLDDGIAAGATTVDGISFDVADRAAAEKSAREAAIADAKAKADTLAAGASVRIVGVASISETVVTPVWYGREYTMAAAAPDASTPVMPGSTDVTITVAVSYLIG